MDYDLPLDMKIVYYQDTAGWAHHSKQDHIVSQPCH